MDEKNKMKIFIACSKHHYNAIPEIKEKLEKRGHKITLPNSFEEPFAEERFKSLDKEEHIKFKQKMMKLHEPKIKKIDALLVLNLQKENNKNYIGGATFMEIVKAWELNKKIFLWNPLPNCSFRDELVGINPLIINHNLNSINQNALI